MPSPFCALLRTKTAYYRTPDGERIFKPDDVDRVLHLSQDAAAGGT